MGRTPTNSLNEITPIMMSHGIEFTLLYSYAHASKIMQEQLTSTGSIRLATAIVLSVLV